MSIADQILKDELAAKEQEKQKVAAELRAKGQQFSSLVKETAELRVALAKCREN